MSDKEPMTWSDIILGLIAWCAGTEMINAAISGFRVFFGGRHPEDWLHIQIGGGLAVMSLAMFVWVRLKEKAGDDAKAD